MGTSILATLQGAMNLGVGAGALILGSPVSQYRPTDPLNPLASALQSQLAYFDSDPQLQGKRPAAIGKPIFYAQADATLWAVGDYFTGHPLGTFFVASLEPLKPPMCVRCNATLTFVRPGSAAPSATYYSGDEPGTETRLLAGWPASLLQGTKGERSEANLPGDTRLPWYAILLPLTLSVQLQPDDVIYDAQPQPNRYTVASVELSQTGWRLTAALAAA